MPAEIENPLVVFTSVIEQPMKSFSDINGRRTFIHDGYDAFQFKTVFLQNGAHKVHIVDTA
jgi:hypothetical protein